MPKTSLVAPKEFYRWATLAIVFFVGLLVSVAESFWLATANDRQPAMIFVNGFPVGEFVGTNSLTVSSDLNPYLVKGTNLISAYTTNTVSGSPSDQNLLRVKLESGESDLTKRQQHFLLERLAFPVDTNIQETISFVGGPQFVVANRGFLKGVKSLTRFEVATMETFYRLQTNPGPNVIEVPVNLPGAPLVSLPWEGPPNVLSADDRTQITALITSIHDALVGEDLNALMPVFTTKLERLAQASGTTLNEKETELRTFFQQLFDTDGFSFDALRPQEFQFRNYETANLVQVLVNGEQPIQGARPGMRYRLPIFLSRISGQWVLVD